MFNQNLMNRAKPQGCISVSKSTPSLDVLTSHLGQNAHILVSSPSQNCASRLSLISVSAQRVSCTSLLSHASFQLATHLSFHLLTWKCTQLIFYPETLLTSSVKESINLLKMHSKIYRPRQIHYMELTANTWSEHWASPRGVTDAVLFTHLCYNEYPNHYATKPPCCHNERG